VSEESTWRQALAIFRELVEADTAAWQDRLTTLAAEGSELRDRVEALLAADALRDARLDGGADRFLSRIRESPEEALSGWLGRQVGPYRIVRLLGWGGMGAVFLGERCDGQFEQRVAIKVARAGLIGHTVIERFLAERRILAGLEHPRIARLLDGGVSAEGVPYFTMEYVEGVPITDYCEAVRLDIERRLRLFLGICEAVDHAHRHLVVHRDLKPSNLLVSREGQVKLLDFGIAKLLDPGLDGTATIDRLLTPAYAAPEQLRGEPVTVAADVYSLGVVLYELLTGQRPFSGSEVARARTLAELDREPERASSVALAQESADPVARRRRRRALRGDLDTILATALHPDPERRYPSALALAEDLRRHLERLPIVARRARLVYRAGKFVARHRWSVAIAASLTVALAAAFAIAIAQARAKVREAAASQQVTSFLVQLFQAPDPTVAKGAELSARELLDQGAERLHSRPIGEPRVSSRLLHTVAATYAALGAYDRALPLAEQALALRRGAFPEKSAEVAESLDQVGEIRHKTADYDGSEPLLREALATRRGLLAANDPALIESLCHLGRLLEDRGAFARAEPLLREALATSERSFGAEAVETAARLDDLAALEADLGRESSAVELLERALAIRERRLGPESPDVAASLARLGERLDEAGDYRQAESRLSRALEIRGRVFGLAHPLAASTELALAGVYMDEDRLDEAEKTAEGALAALRRSLGGSHPKVGEAINLLGIVRTFRRDYAGAEPLFEELLTSYRRRFGERHPDTLSIEGNLAMTVLHRGRAAEAERLQRDVLAKLSADNGQATGALTLQNLATSLEIEGRPREAVTFARQALELQRRREGETSGNVAIAVRSLAVAEELAGDAGAAERDFRAGLQMGEELAPTHGNATYEWRIPLADFLVGEHRCEEARSLLHSSAEELARRGSASDPVWRLEERLLAAACEAPSPASGPELVAARAALHALPSIEVDLFPTARALLAGR
jgi:tetratricopeptide (TPR) repeat protein